MTATTGKKTYTRVVCFFFSDAGAVVVASGLPLHALKPQPKAARGAKGVGHASSDDI
jgi:hypothetical protein